uniref:Metalloendopeptidase n=1 Tax=Parastrongyloides trichosuri TaxID=131310 RepID=A0A0N4ZDA6_PARTI
MLFINFVSFIFLIFCFIVRVNTRRLPQSKSIDVPYLFTGITVCNGSRLANVKLELWTKRGIFYTSVLLSKNHSDPYGVFALKTYVPSNLQKELQLYFRYNCDLKDRIKYPHRKKYSKYVSSFGCPWDRATKGIKNPKQYMHKVKEQIKIAIKEIQNNTCINFENREEIIQNKSGINFIKSHKCESEKIGETLENKSQTIYLTDECAQSMRTIRSLLHETLGQFSPVLRKDGNKYVQVNLLYLNLSKIEMFNYSYQPIQNYTGYYDFGSIMHFNSTMFSVDEKIETIRPIVKYGNYIKSSMGRIGEASFYDYKTLNKYYCSHFFNVTPSPKSPSCLFEGYLNPINKSTCVCREEYFDEQCRSLSHSFSSQCGFNKIEAKQFLQKWIRSEIHLCEFLIHANDTKKHVFLRLPSFKGTFEKKDCSLKNSINIDYKGDKSEPGLCLCYNKDLETIEVVSESFFIAVGYRFHWYKTFVYFEYMEVNSTNFKYSDLSDDQKMAVFRNVTSDQVKYPPNDL